MDMVEDENSANSFLKKERGCIDKLGMNGQDQSSWRYLQFDG